MRKLLSKIFSVLASEGLIRHLANDAMQHKNLQLTNELDMWKNAEGHPMAAYSEGYEDGVASVDLPEAPKSNGTPFGDCLPPCIDLSNQEGLNLLKEANLRGADLSNMGIYGRSGK